MRFLQNINKNLLLLWQSFYHEDYYEVLYACYELDHCITQFLQSKSRYILHKDSNAYFLKFHVRNFFLFGTRFTLELEQHSLQNGHYNKMRQPLSMSSTLQCSQLISFSSSCSTMVVTSYSPGYSSE